MNITLHIPDSVARSLRIAEAEAEELRQELAAVLYAGGLLSFVMPRAVARLRESRR